MSEAINQAVSDRICKHMNEDHQDAIILYAEAFGQLQGVKSAKMISIDHEGMNIEVNHTLEETIRIEFDHTLENSQDAHHTLVNMIKTAKQV